MRGVGKALPGAAGRAAWLLAVVGLAGCAAVSRPATTPAAIAGDGLALARADAELRDSVLARLARRSLDDDTLDVLYLSGGGQNGAWGAAFLRGWFDRPDAAMPRFDLITGISTGALQAPFVLQGAAAPLDTLRQLYLSSATTFAPSVDWWFWLRRTGGVVTTKKYERTLAAVMDSGRIAALRAALADDRQLLVATTDLDLGVGRIWDVGERLQRGGAALDTVRTLLYTATAIPGIFPPRLIEGHLHVDGGVVANALSLLDRTAVQRLVALRHAAGRTSPLHVRLWVVMNVWTHVSPAVTPASRRGRIYDRAYWVTFWSAMPQFLQSLDATAHAVTSGVPGATMTLRIAAPPASLGEEKGALTLFDARWMARLDSLGVQAARSANPWSPPGSAYARPVPVTVDGGAARPLESSRPLTATVWRATAIDDGAGGVAPVMAGSVVTAEFTTAARLSGSAGCNRYTASVALGGGDALTLGAAATTRRLCTDPGAMQQEQRFLAVFPRVARYVLSADVLEWRAVSGAVLARFTAAP